MLDGAGGAMGYDVEAAIRAVMAAAKQLHDDTDSRVHRFRMEWVEQLAARYRANPGKPLVHLSDLMDSLMVQFETSGSEELRELHRRLFEIPNRLQAWRRYQAVLDHGESIPSKFVPLGLLRDLGQTTGLDLDDVEPYVLRLKTSSGPRVRTVENPRLPFSLASPAGAKLIGYRLDTSYSNSAFTNKVPILHEDYRQAVRNVVGDITITQTQSSGGNFNHLEYLRTNVGYLVTRILSVAGCDNTREQRLSNSPAPLWLINCDRGIVSCFVASAWDAEGSVNKRNLQLRQTASIAWPTTQPAPPKWPDALRCSKTPSEIREAVFGSPPLFLVSTAVLLKSLGIDCRLEPDRISSTRSGPSVYWFLRVYRNESVKNFHDSIRLISPRKSAQLSANVASIKWSWGKFGGTSRKPS